MEILRLSGRKDSYHTIKYLEVELTFQPTENDHCAPSGISLLQNEHLVEILSCCLVKIILILLWVLLNKYLPKNCINVLLTVLMQNT